MRMYIVNIVRYWISQKLRSNFGVCVRVYETMVGVSDVFVAKSDDLIVRSILFISYKFPSFVATYCSYNL